LSTISDDTRLLVDVPEACRMLGGVSRAYFYELVAANRIVTVKLGKRRLVPVPALEQFTADLLNEGGSDAA
jgi:excisionase family DNA binding protein